MHTSYGLDHDISYVFFFYYIAYVYELVRGHDMSRPVYDLLFFACLQRVYNVFTAQSKKGSRTAMACVRV